MNKSLILKAALAAIATCTTISEEDVSKLSAQESAQNIRNAFQSAYASEQFNLGLKYSTFYEAMNHYKYNWEAVEVTTEDGYLDTMFHITRKTGYEWFKPTRPEIPVLIMHGAFADGTSSLQIYKEEFGASENVPLPLALFDAGFDVWIGNARGTQYSQGGDKDPSTAEFWDFDFKSSAYDVAAFVDAITEKTGRFKVNLIGSEMGSSPIFYGLSTTD